MPSPEVPTGRVIADLVQRLASPDLSDQLDLSYREIAGVCYLSPQWCDKLQREQPVKIPMRVLWADTDSEDFQIEIARIGIKDLLGSLLRRLPQLARTFVPSKGQSFRERPFPQQDLYVLTTNDIALLAAFGQEGYQLTITPLADGEPSGEQRKFADRRFNLITGTRAIGRPTDILTEIFLRAQRSVLLDPNRGYSPPSSMAASGR